MLTEKSQCVCEEDQAGMFSQLVEVFLLKGRGAVTHREEKRNSGHTGCAAS